MDPKNLRYEGEDCIYTDPDSKYEYKWDKEKNEWLSNVENSEKPNQSAENQTNLPDNHNYEFDGKHYIHTDKESGIFFFYNFHLLNCIITFFYVYCFIFDRCHLSFYVILKYNFNIRLYFFFRYQIYLR